MAQTVEEVLAEQGVRAKILGKYEQIKEVQEAFKEIEAEALNNINEYNSAIQKRFDSGLKADPMLVQMTELEQERLSDIQDITNSTIASIMNRSI